MRVAVVDIGTNSTRLLIADVVDAGVTELVRESNVTRLGEGVDKTGELGEQPQQRVFTVLDRYRGQIDEHGAERTIAVLTSAVRDASNGEQFRQAVKDRYGLDARTIPGEEEASLTFLGATSEREHTEAGEIVVIDIGGGSTEFVVGDGGDVSFFTSLQMGVVRMTERHLHSDPPAEAEVAALIDDVRSVISAGIPEDVRRRVAGGVAVAGTATSAGAMDLELEPYDPDRVHGHVVTLDALTELLSRLSAMPNEERKRVPGLHPDRAITIVAGMATLRECARALGLGQIEVSEHDILRGAALRVAGSAT